MLKKIWITVITLLVLLNSLSIPFNVRAEDDEKAEVNIEEVNTEQEEEIDSVEEVDNTVESDAEEVQVEDNDEEPLPENAAVEETAEVLTAGENKYSFDSLDIDEYSGCISGDMSLAAGNRTLTKYKYTYDDAWFIDKPSYIYNHDLAKMSLKMAMSGFYASALKDFYDRTGFTYTDNVTSGEELSSNDSIVYTDTWKNFEYFNEENDTIGYGIAYRNVEYNDKTYTIVAVTVRGGNYEAEWASNFTIGKSDDAYGFNQAAKNIQAKVKDYLGSINSPYETKLWITGYSRGAAAANLCGYYLDLDAYADKLYGIHPEDIYTYTFETPKGKEKASLESISYTYNGRTEELENNIFNIINNTDMITKTAMGNLGFVRCGVDKILPAVLTVSDYVNSDIYKNMTETYRQIFAYDNYYINDEELASLTTMGVNQNATFNSFAYTLAEVLNDSGNDARINYADSGRTNAQNVCRFLMTDLMARNDRVFYSISLWVKTKNSTSSKITKKFSDIMDMDTLEYAELILEILGTFVLYESNMTNFYMEITTSDESGNNQTSGTITLTKNQYSRAKSILTSQVVPYIKNNSGSIEKIEDYIIYAHYPELCLAWMESGDASIFAKQRYTRYKVKSAYADIVVKYKNNTVANISSGSVNNSAVEAYEDENDNLVVVVPEDENYSVEISLGKYWSSTSYYAYLETYNVNNEDTVLRSASLKLSKGNTTVFVSKRDGYTANGSLMSLTKDIEDVNDVTVALSYDTKAGLATGGGRYPAFKTVEMSVESTNPGYIFKGWYDEFGMLISEEESFDYVAEYSTTLVPEWDYDPDLYISEFINVDGMKATLSDSIVLTVYLKLDESLASKGDITVHYTVDGNNEKTMVLSSLQYSSDGYALDVDLDARNINKKIKVWFEYKSVEGNAKELSLSEYCDMLIEQYPDDEEIRNLASAVKTYGEYSDIYFNDKQSTADLSVPEKLDDYQFTLLTDGTSREFISLKNTSLVLDSKTSIKIYYEIADGFTLDDFDLVVSDIEESRIEITDEYILIKDIRASELMNRYRIEIPKDDNLLIRLIYSPMSYVRQASMLEGDEHRNLRNLCIALYNYGVSSNNYQKKSIN